MYYNILLQDELNRFFLIWTIFINRKLYCEIQNFNFKIHKTFSKYLVRRLNQKYIFFFKSP